MKRSAPVAACVFRHAAVHAAGRIHLLGHDGREQQRNPASRVLRPQATAVQFPAIGERLATFFRSAPSRDGEEMNAVAWSFGQDGMD